MSAGAKAVGHAKSTWGESAQLPHAYDEGYRMLVGKLGEHVEHDIDWDTPGCYGALALWEEAALLMCDGAEAAWIAKELRLRYGSQVECDGAELQAQVERRWSE